jgi:hypothetical protein
MRDGDLGEALGRARARGERRKRMRGRSIQKRERFLKKNVSAQAVILRSWRCSTNDKRRSRIIPIKGRGKRVPRWKNSATSR